MDRVVFSPAYNSAMLEDTFYCWSQKFQFIIVSQICTQVNVRGNWGTYVDFT